MENKSIEGQSIDFALRLFVVNQHRNDVEVCQKVIEEIMENAGKINKFIHEELGDKTPGIEAIDSALKLFEMYSQRTGRSATFIEVKGEFLLHTAGKMREFIQAP